MVARVISGKDIKGALNYNEQKVLQGNARCILASGFMAEHDKLNFHQKVLHFVNLNERNTRSKTNTLHISLNFHPGEKQDANKLAAIGAAYMDRIGFGDQPFLIYEHTDAAHPHIHIVTTIIQQGGKRLPIHNLGKNESEKARKEIEIEFGLIQAQGQDKTSQLLTPIDVTSVVYGKSETKRAISKIVGIISRTYKYSSLAELNAALKQFNVMADRGTERSQMFQKKGLVYSLTDEKGNRIGIPIKASAFSGKPTLLFLEKQFRLNDALKKPLRYKLSQKVDHVVQAKTVLTPEQFGKALAKSGVTAIFRRTKEGRAFGVTFVDNQLRAVFNGSDLGKAYSAGAILGTLSAKTDTITPFNPGSAKGHDFKPDIGIARIFTDLISSEENFNPAPLSTKEIRKRKKRRRF